MMNTLIQDCVDFLNITRPYRVILQTRLRNPDWFAYHTALIDDNGKVIRHVIKLTMQDFSEYHLSTVLAHEFVHAWQTEYHIKGAMHGKRFVKKAEELKSYLVSRGHNIYDIYRPEIDASVK